MASTFSVEVELKSNPQKVWDCVSDFTNFGPKSFPQVFESIVVLKGDGRSTGTVRSVNYVKEAPVASLVEELELVDDEKKTIKWNAIGGDVVKLYKRFKATVVVSPVEGDGSLVKYSGEYERVEGQPAIPENIEERLIFSIGAFGHYLEENM